MALGLKKAVLASDQPFLKAARLGWWSQIYLLSGKYSCLFLFFTREIRSGKKEAGEEKMKKKMVVGGAHRDCFSGYLEAPPP